MTLMIASVTDAEEAETAVQHGAEIIDVKAVDGSFGTAAPALVRATVDAVAQRRCVSAVVGEPRSSRRRSHERCGDYRRRWRELRPTQFVCTLGAGGLRAR
jgi:4-HFC-P synthase